MKVILLLNCLIIIVISNGCKNMVKYRCDDNSWILSEDKNNPPCYKLLWFANDTKHSFNESKHLCETEEAYVASVNNDLQQNAIVEAISLIQQNSSASQMFYIGLRDIVTAVNDTRVDYRWDHGGTPLGTFTKWLDVNPDEYYLDCIVVYPKKGYVWWNMDCTASKYIYGVVCAKESTTNK